MGLFQLRRELLREGTAKARAAKAKAATLGASGSVDALIEDAWASDLDPKIIEPLFRSSKNDTLSLALARLDARSDESKRALIEENASLITPVVASWLSTDRATNAAQLLAHLGDARAVPALRRAVLAAKSQTDNRVPFFLFALAQLGDPETLAFVAERVGAGTPAPVVAALARRGVASMRSRCLQSVRSWLDDRKNLEKRHHRDDATAALQAIDALGEARSLDALPLLHEVLGTPYSPAALRALERIADPSSRAPVERMLDLLAGDGERNWPYRLGGEAVLRALGDSPSLDAAREVLAWSHPRRYGWPKSEDHALLIALAASALLSGTKEELLRVAKLVADPVRVLRLVGARAHERAHGSKPKLRYFDPELARNFVKKERGQVVLDAIESGVAVFRHNLVRELAKTKDAKAKKALVELAVRELESRLNHRVDYYESSDLGPDASGWMDALEVLGKAADAKRRLVSSSSLWIQHHLLKKDPPAWPSLPPPASALESRVTKLGEKARGAFAIGRHINGLALSHDGARLAVVGDQLGLIAAADGGAGRLELNLKYYWAYDVAFSNDGSRLVITYHGGHVVVIDTTSGEIVMSLEGHGGVPDGVKRVAFSPDGKLLITCGSDGRAFLWGFPSGKRLYEYGDGRGSFEGLAFSPDGKHFALAHVKARGGEENHLLIGDTKTGKAQRVKTPSSMWSVVFRKDGSLIAAGEGTHIVLYDRKFRPVGKLAQSEVVRMLMTPDDESLFAVSQTGDARRWDLASGKSVKLEVGEGQVWALARDPKAGTTFIAGTQGVIHRFDDEGKSLESAPLTVHTQQVRGFARMKTGRFFTCGWDGRLIVWNEDGQPERVMHHTEERMTELALTADESCLLVLHNGGLLAFDVATSAITGTYAPKKTQSSVTNPESLAVSVDGRTAAVGHYGGHVVTFELPNLDRKAEGSTGKREVSALAAGADGGWIAGIDDGRVVGLGPGLDVEWTLAAHGRDLVEGEPMGNPHATVMSLCIAPNARGFASAATDHAVRSWDGERVPLKRWLTHSGLFNNVVFSPSGNRLATTSSWTLEVFDTETGELLARLDRSCFSGADELTRAAWTNEEELLVGAENGSAFRVKLA